MFRFPTFQPIFKLCKFEMWGSDNCEEVVVVVIDVLDLTTCQLNQVPPNLALEALFASGSECCPIHLVCFFVFSLCLSFSLSLPPPHT